MTQNKRKNIFKYVLRVFPVFLLCTAISACGVNAPRQSDKPIAYTSFYAMYDLTRRIAGDKMQVENLLPPGAEPHDYEPTAKELISLYNSSVLVYCGSGIDEYMDNIRADAEKKGITVINTCQNVSVKSDDPHVWLLPDNALAQLQSITDGLCSADPQNSEYYKNNLSSAKEEIQNLKAQCDVLKSSAKLHSIVVSHGAYGYLCDYIGIDQVAIEGIHGTGDPSASRMAELAEYIKKNNIKYIFSSPDENSKAAETLCTETGAKPLTLSTFEYDTENKDYFTIMSENINALSQALEVDGN